MSSMLLRTILGPLLPNRQADEDDVPVVYRTIAPPAPMNVNGPVGGPTGGPTDPTGNTPTPPIP